jgi:hypothetical protein
MTIFNSYVSLPEGNLKIEPPKSKDYHKVLIKMSFGGVYPIFSNTQIKLLLANREGRSVFGTIHIGGLNAFLSRVGKVLQIMTLLADDYWGGGTRSPKRTQ